MTLLPRLIVHVFWRDELQAWMLAADGSPGFTTLVHRMSYEGHPLGWYILLWALNHFTSNPEIIKALHALIATGVVFLIATFLPASRLIRVLLCASYFIAFEYAAISRLYSLGMLPLFGFAALRTWRPDAYLRQALCLALATQANAYSAMLAGILALWTGAEWLRAGRPMPARFFAAVAILMVAFAVTALELVGPADRYYQPNGSTIYIRATTGLAGVWASFFPGPMPIRAWWNTNFIDGVVPEGRRAIAKAFLGVIVLMGSTWSLPNLRSRLFWLAGASVLLAFGTIQFSGYLRHHGHFFLLFVIVWWLSYRERGDQTTLVAKVRDVGILAVFAFQALIGIGASIVDSVLPFSASRAAAQYIQTHFSDAQLISKNDSVTSPIAGYLRKQMFYLRTNRLGSYIVWDTAPRIDKPSPESYTAVARRLDTASPGHPIIVILNTDLSQAPEEQYFERLESFTNSSIASEQYTIYRWTGSR